MSDELINDDELPGLWSRSDFQGGDPDPRSYTQRMKDLTAQRDEAINHSKELTVKYDEALAKLAAMTADECVYMAEPRGAFGLAEGWCGTHNIGWVWCKAGQTRLIELLRSRDWSKGEATHE